MTPRKRKALAAAQAAAALSRHRQAIAAARPLVPLVRKLRRRGLSYQRIADALNEQGHRTRRGQRFHAAQARNILILAAQPANRDGEDRGRR
jgi:hypothetical protein